MIIWLEFIFCSGIIVFCGTKLSIYGDIIAEKAGLGRAWIVVLSSWQCL
jgi:cation:H+ antiporter